MDGIDIKLKKQSLSSGTYSMESFQGGKRLFQLLIPISAGGRNYFSLCGLCLHTERWRDVSIGGVAFSGSHS